MNEGAACFLLIVALALASIQSAVSAEAGESKEADVSMMPDYSKLDLKGNGHTQDSFSLAVQSAARLLGKEADYETICCLSGNAFAPAINKGENCTAWWHVEGWQGDVAMDTVAAALGLNAAPLELSPNDLSPEDSKEEFERKALTARKKYALVVRGKMEEGAVIITAGGWRVWMDEGLAPWGWWGVITKTTDDGDIRGACLGADPGKAVGFRDRPLDYLGDCWTLSPGRPAVEAGGTDATVLRQAVARIRGTGPYAATGNSVYGLAAMDAWIEQMAKVPFCSACAHAGPEGMAGCAVNNVQTILSGAQTAAAYLRKRAPSLEPEAQEHVEAAARHYDKILELLSPATWGFYRDRLNDAEKQAAHVENALKPVKTELSLAADELENALIAMQKP